MEQFDIFEDIAERTGGDIYLGVVGPVRTGKSTFVKRFMELLVLNHIEDEHELERTKDELPQSGAGRTIMTTEPKFVPDEGVAITINEALRLRVRLVDSVGFPVDGAKGYLEEDDEPRMVVTPWFDHAIPFGEAAEVGTRKVIAEHSTIGIVVTTDGSFGELERDRFEAAEEQTVNELQQLGKPFIVVLNTVYPEAEVSRSLSEQLADRYDVPVVPVNVDKMSQGNITDILEEALYEFPVHAIDVLRPDWVAELDPDHAIPSELRRVEDESFQNVIRLRDVVPAVHHLQEHDLVDTAVLESMDLGTGEAVVEVQTPPGLFHDVLEDVAGITLAGDADLLRLVRELTEARDQFVKLEAPLEEAERLGYGIVVPREDDMTFEEPELIQRGKQYGVRLAAGAPSLHLIRADIRTEVTPMIGSENQSRQLVNYLKEKFEDDPAKIWESDIFGKSLHDLLREDLEDKLEAMPENARKKLQETIQRILNEGGGGLICLII